MSAFALTQLVCIGLAGIFVATSWVLLRNIDRRKNWIIDWILIILFLLFAAASMVVGITLNSLH